MYKCVITDTNQAELDKAETIYNYSPREFPVFVFEAPHFKAAKQQFKKLCAEHNWLAPYLDFQD